MKSHLLGREAPARRILAMLAAVAALLIAASAVAGAHGSGKGASDADRLRAIEQKPHPSAGRRGHRNRAQAHGGRLPGDQSRRGSAVA